MYLPPSFNILQLGPTIQVANMKVDQDNSDGLPTFGHRYAVLNLDLMTILVDAIKGTPAGDTFIANCRRWNDAVHQKDPRPVSIFTSLFFDHKHLELKHDSPFEKLISGFGSFEVGSKEVQIAPEFQVDDKDIVLQKTRWYAGAGNALEQILKAQNIDTVIIVGNSVILVRMGLIRASVVRVNPLRGRDEHHLPIIRPGL